MVFVEDMSAFFADFSVAVAWTPSDGSPALTANALFDTPGVDLFGGGQISTDYALTVNASDLASIDTGETVVVAGISYTVREVRLIDDGALKHITLSKQPY